MTAVATQRDGRTFKTEMITPEMARGMLASQGLNRRLDKFHVRRLAEDIIEGRWIPNGDTLKTDPDGTVWDGQHRLAAIIAADRAVEMDVAYDVPRAAQTVTDTNKPRSAGDALALLGYENSVRLAAVLRWVAIYERSEPGQMIGGGLGHIISHGALLEVLDRHPGVKKSIDLITVNRKDLRPLLPEATAAFVHYMAGRSSKPKADEFIDSLATGIGLTKGSPVRHLRRVLTSNASAQRKLHRYHVYALTAKAWLAFEVGKEMGQLKWLDSEGFPVFRFDKRPRPPK